MSMFENVTESRSEEEMAEREEILASRSETASGETERKVEVEGGKGVHEGRADTRARKGRL